MKLFSPDGRELGEGVEPEVECAFMAYLEPNGGQTHFDVSIKLGGIKTKRFATYDDVLRMCSEIVSTLQALKTNAGMEKMLDIKEKIKSGELKVTDRGIEVHEPAKDTTTN
jgi:hypothetical protein